MNAPPPLTLELGPARLLQLAATGLLDAHPRRALRKHLLQAIERMRLLQIDTISVVARSPYLVLHSRIGDYPAQWLDEALARAELVETWAHEACFAPVQHHPWHRAHQQQRKHWSNAMAARAMATDGTDIAALVERIRHTGAARSADFERQSPSGGWWSWKPEKRWLETAFVTGALMVARREGFQRVYDVPERVLAQHPHLLDDPPDATTTRHWMIGESVRALGVATAAQIGDYFRLHPRVDDHALAPLCSAGILHPVQVAGWERIAYVHGEDLPLLQAARAGTLHARRTVLLSPFDPLVWDRQRALDLFDFDYRLECYTPAAKRQYGYFVLPLLDRDRLVGRLDAKAHRREGVFEVRALYLQPGVRPSAALAGRLHRAIARSAAWHGTPQVRYGTCEPAVFGVQLRAAAAG